jgi:hypothetical protein
MQLRLVVLRVVLSKWYSGHKNLRFAQQPCQLLRRPIHETVRMIRQDVSVHESADPHVWLSRMDHPMMHRGQDERGTRSYDGAGSLISHRQLLTSRQCEAAIQPALKCEAVLGPTEQSRITRKAIVKSIGNDGACDGGVLGTRAGTKCEGFILGKLHHSHNRQLSNQSSMMARVMVMPLESEQVPNAKVSS